MPKVDYGDGLTVNYTDGEYERLQEIRKNMDPGRPKGPRKSLADRCTVISVSMPMWLKTLMDEDSSTRGEKMSKYIQDAILRKATGVENEPST